MSDEREFRTRYGDWALIAGASEGIGEAFAEALARRGLDLLLIARRADRLEATARGLRERYPVEVDTLALDLAVEDVGERVLEFVAEREVGLLVYNAAFARMGEFLEQPLAAATSTIAVNCRGPVVLAHQLGARMRARGRGGIVLMGSLAGLQGSARLASYAASKAFLQMLGESLWAELQPAGVDAITILAGATRTPGYLASGADAKGIEMEPREVADEALAWLCSGRRPSAIVGWKNRLAAGLLGLLSRRRRVELMSGTVKRGA